MQHDSLAHWIGYDPALVAQMTPARRRALAFLTEGFLLSSGLLAAPVAYAAWLVEHSLALALGAGAGAFLIVINLLRLVVTGSGAAPHGSEREVRGHRPALGPSVLLGALALLLAQPAQLPLWRQELAEPVAQERAALLAASANSNVNSELKEQRRQRLEECEFVVVRLHGMWRQPVRAVSWTALYVLLVLGPALLARFFALNALREYELLRWREQRSVIEREALETRRRSSALLRAWPSYGRDR